jgi:hypothetical protein
MELTPHYRVVRFSPAPELHEPVNVALLLVDEKARLITDYVFQKLHCVAPRFNSKLLQFLLEHVQEELHSIKPEEAHIFLSAQTAQLQVGEPQRLTRGTSKDFEAHLIDLYLKRPTQVHKPGESHFRYVDTLLDEALTKVSFDAGSLIKRAHPSDFLSPDSISLLASKTMKFSRVLNGNRKIVLLDGLNLAVASKQQLKQRASEIGFGFYTMGKVRGRIESIEKKALVRAAFVFNQPATIDAELVYFQELIRRDADISVQSDTGHNLMALGDILQSANSGLIE